jgi:DNA-binding response OmpR family regulator
MSKILIVEDDALILRMYQEAFTSEGFEVLFASDGQAGLDMARANKPTIILLDIMMPKLNGMQMLEQLKADPAIHTIPVIVLTNLSSTMDAEKALKLGAVKYVVKSDYKPREIITIVKDILAGYTRGDGIPVPRV